MICFLDWYWKRKIHNPGLERGGGDDGVLVNIVIEQQLSGIDWRRKTRLSQRLSFSFRLVHESQSIVNISRKHLSTLLVSKTSRQLKHPSVAGALELKRSGKIPTQVHLSITFHTCFLAIEANPGPEMTIGRTYCIY